MSGLNHTAINGLDFVKLLVDFKTGTFKIDLEDDIVKATLVTA